MGLCRKDGDESWYRWHIIYSNYGKFQCSYQKLTEQNLWTIIADIGLVACSNLRHDYYHWVVISLISIENRYITHQILYNVLLRKSKNIKLSILE